MNQVGVRHTKQRIKSARWRTAQSACPNSAKSSASNGWPPPISGGKSNEIRGTSSEPVWQQRNYYECIIRNERELNAIRRCIRNSAHWAEDPENPSHNSAFRG